MVGTKFGGRETGDFSECFCKIVRISVTDRLPDAVDTAIGCNEQALRRLHAHLCQVSGETLSEVLAKQSAEVRFRIVHCSRHLGKRDIRGIMIANILTNRKNTETAILFDRFFVARTVF